MVKFKNGILYAKTICDFINNSEAFNDYELYATTFCNGRESGYRLTVYTPKKDGNLYIWIHEERHSETCVIRWGDYNECDLNNMYSEKVYNEQSKEFEEFNPFIICKFILERIEEYFAKQRDIKAEWENGNYSD